jgi:gentisate 1,2-dioxygenase
VIEKHQLISFSRWKDLKNIYRTQWKVNNVPALVRYQRVNGEVSETGRLIEAEILDKAKLQAFLA